jgi:hypothetical protein
MRQLRATRCACLIDGMYTRDKVTGAPVFHFVAASAKADIEKLAALNLRARLQDARAARFDRRGTSRQQRGRVGRWRPGGLSQGSAFPRALRAHRRAGPRAAGAVRRRSAAGGGERRTAQAARWGARHRRALCAASAISRISRRSTGRAAAKRAARVHGCSRATGASLCARRSRSRHRSAAASETHRMPSRASTP